MKTRNYEIIEHTADIGLRVKAGNPKGLFRNAAAAMFQVMAEPKGRAVKAAEELFVKLNAENLEELFVNWLNELLSLSAAKELIFSDFKINTLEDNRLEAVVIGRPQKDFRINSEIKAATYHELKVEETASGWVAEVIFDV